MNINFYHFQCSSQINKLLLKLNYPRKNCFPWFNVFRYQKERPRHIFATQSNNYFANNPTPVKVRVTVFVCCTLDSSDTKVVAYKF